MNRLIKLLIISIGCMSVGLVLYFYDTRPRIALWRAGFSHQTYWRGSVSLLRAEIECSDRNPSLNGWMDYFPRLERLRLTAGGDNINHFDSLLPFTRIPALRELTLAGVDLGSVDDIPAFPCLEELRLYESSCWWRDATSKPYQLKRLRERLPKLKVLWIDDDYSKSLRFDPTRNEIVFREKEA